MREDCLSIYPRTKKTLTDGWWLPTYSLKLKERGGFQDLDGLPTLSIYPIHPDGSWNRFSFCFILHTHAHTLPFFNHTIHTYTLKWTALSILLCGLEAAVTVTVYTTQYCDERWLLPHRLTLPWLLYSWLFRSVLVLVVVSLSSHPCQELVLYIYILTHTHTSSPTWIGSVGGYAWTYSKLEQSWTFTFYLNINIRSSLQNHAGFSLFTFVVLVAS